MSNNGSHNGAKRPQRSRTKGHAARHRLIKTWRLAKRLRLPSSQTVVTFISVILLASLFIGWRSSSTNQYSEQEVFFFQIGTGPSNDRSFNFGHKIATSISKPPGSENCSEKQICGVDNLIAIAKATQGTISNIQNVGTGRLDSAFVLSDLALDAYNAQGSFVGNQHNKLRSLGNLYPAAIHLVASKASSIKSLSDLKKKRLSINVNNTPSNIEAKKILQLNGVKLDSFILFNTSSSESAKMIKAGSIDAFFHVSMIPSPLITDLANENLVDIIPLSIPFFKKESSSANKLIAKYMIPANSYGQASNIETVAINTLWVASEDTSSQIIHDILQSFWNNDDIRPDIENFELSPKHALLGNTIPLHRGAIWYYTENGHFQ